MPAGAFLTCSKSCSCLIIYTHTTKPPVWILWVSRSNERSIGCNNPADTTEFKIIYRWCFRSCSSSWRSAGGHLLRQDLNNQWRFPLLELHTGYRCTFPAGSPAADGCRIIPGKHVLYAHTTTVWDRSKSHRWNYLPSVQFSLSAACSRWWINATLASIFFLFLSRFILVSCLDFFSL